ncbi:MAG TPA: hydrolase [Thermoplasmata archaeon]|nr:hydrolase [Thermoplasmata archaeon]
MKDKDSKSGPCCPRFNPDLWEGKTSDWGDRLFIKDTIRQFLHRPLPSSMGKAVGRMWKEAKDSGAAPAIEDFLLLSYDPSPWKSELFMTVTKEVPGVENVQLPGTYISKVFDGPYNSPPKWIKVMETYVASKGKKSKKFLFYFTTCPRCAKIYGHNYAVVFAQVD